MHLRVVTPGLGALDSLGLAQGQISAGKDTTRVVQAAAGLVAALIRLGYHVFNFTFLVVTALFAVAELLKVIVEVAVVID